MDIIDSVLLCIRLIWLRTSGLHGQLSCAAEYGLIYVVAIGRFVYIEIETSQPKY